MKNLVFCSYSPQVWEWAPVDQMKLMPKKSQPLRRSLPRVRVEAEVKAVQPPMVTSSPVHRPTLQPRRARQVQTRGSQMATSLLMINQTARHRRPRLQSKSIRCLFSALMAKHEFVALADIDCQYDAILMLNPEAANKAKAVTKAFATFDKEAMTFIQAMEKLPASSSKRKVLLGQLKTLAAKLYDQLSILNSKRR